MAAFYLPDRLFRPVGEEALVCSFLVRLGRCSYSVNTEDIHISHSPVKLQEELSAHRPMRRPLPSLENFQFLF